ncbi:hypothetical protein F1880_001363 [Penicillium rolfsii]|nr:hypothetical protein F1880_001363 [Penicillium rolfsii]
MFLNNANITSTQLPSAEPIVREGSPIGFDEDFEVDLAASQDSVIALNLSQVNLPETARTLGDSRRDLKLELAKTTPSVANPYPGWLRWLISESGVFESQQEELSAVHYGKSHDNLFKNVHDNSFFQWGLRFIPGPGQENIFRTMVIECLPKTVTLDRILPQIRGGAVFSASLMDTFAISGYATALITFVHQAGALNFLRLVARHGFFLGISPAQVRPVPTPTYLMSKEIETQIFQFGRTRCVLVSSDNHKSLKQDVSRVLSQSRLRHSVERFGERDADGEVTVRFDSIKMAWAACLLLASDSKLQGVLIKPAVDPCSLL